MLTLVRSIVSVLAYRFRSGRRLVEATLDNAAPENLLGKNRRSLHAGAPMEFTTRGRAYRRQPHLAHLSLARSIFLLAVQP